MSTKLEWGLNTGGFHFRLTSAHAPQHPVITYVEMGTVGLGSHGLLRQPFVLNVDVVCIKFTSVKDLNVNDVLDGNANVLRCSDNKVAAIRDISRSCLDPNDFTVLNCIVKGHSSFSPPFLRLRLCSRFTLLAAYTYFDHKDFSPHPIDSVKGHASLLPLEQQKAKKNKNKTKKKHRFTQ
ncbi:hypothetical protein TNCV_754871 [Trichonephila clavipes]|nr:hypothetical protein TNCV_754871 [Trichonephila clavipes]